jgi:hypothetical protein
MDDKQADRIHVYGFIHEFLRNKALIYNIAVARIIEPPNVILQTDLTPSGVLYQGGPFLIDSSFTSAVNALLTNATFSKVTITRLTTTFTSDHVFLLRLTTRILVISDGYWGKTFLTLARMGISYTQVSTDQVMANPSMINQYTLIVLDSPGWYGNPSAHTPLHRSEINAIYNTIRADVAAGDEVMYTDAAMYDLNSTFPDYIKLGNPGETGSWKSLMHNPAIGKSVFDSDPTTSQYYNPGPNPNQVTIFTEGGIGNWVPNGVQPAHTGDVGVLLDTTNYGIPELPYAILAFYFPYGAGIVEGLALQPYEQLYPTYANYNGYYTVYQIYGNECLEGPSLLPDFSLTASPPSIIVSKTQTAIYQITVVSLGISGTLNLQVMGLPIGTRSTFALSGSILLGEGQLMRETLNVLTTKSTPPGNYNLTITGSSMLHFVPNSYPIAHNVDVGLVVTAPAGDFRITVSPSQLYVSPGIWANITFVLTIIELLPVNGNAIRSNLLGGIERDT